MWFGRNLICWGMLFMSLHLHLLTYGASFNIVADPFLHSNPPVVLLDFS